jgi:ribosomal protein S18 acetylase RimI-like enzyme
VAVITDLGVVRAALNRDRAWAAYAIGDLAPGFVDQCEWHMPTTQSSAVLLLYRGFEPAVAFAMGERDSLRDLFQELSAERMSLHVRQEGLDALEGVYAPVDVRKVQRMVLSPNRFQPADLEGIEALGEGDLDEVNALYEDGYRRGEGPTFFHPSMLQQGTFRGVREGRALVSIAGTHLYSPDLGVCAIGNVYTRRNHRGRGLAARVTSAVATLAIHHRVDTIVLNVGEDNVSARRVYQRLGFDEYCEFFEGEARRLS